MDHRLPVVDPQSTCGLVVTDPLVRYRNYVSRGILKEDIHQLRAAVEFQKLYYRVVNYSPAESDAIKIKELVRKLQERYDGSSLLSKYAPNWYHDMQESKRTEMVRVLTDEEEMGQIAAPRGLLVTGEVGCGKSLLMDIFANCLPHDSKRRWHYNAFMLWVYSEIHHISQRRLTGSQTNHSMLSVENELVLFEIASKMISQNAILMLDEFMLPDLTASNIVKILFTYFFKLGGVLVASSNRLPDQLYSSNFNRAQIKYFDRVLKLRCDFLDMKSPNDYRELLSRENTLQHHLVSKASPSHQTTWGNLLDSLIKGQHGSPDKLSVYGRTLHVPWQSQGVVMYPFEEICQGLYGPGDYISLASKYHTFVIDHVPVMTFKMKNEARRFITLLDALYESRCQLFLRTETGLDSLFFPEAASKESWTSQDEETYAKAQIDAENPYRPNAASYSTNKFDYSKDARANFKELKNFTGEDEMFAFKRAVSRIKEMTGSQSWRKEGRWIALDKSMMPWESDNACDGTTYSDEKGLSHQKDAPVFAEPHFWAMGTWGKGARLKDELAKKWIKGTEA